MATGQELLQPSQIGYKHRQDECDLAVVNEHGLCELGRISYPGCRCMSPLVGTKGLSCPYWWPPPLKVWWEHRLGGKTLSMKDVEDVAKSNPFPSN